MNKDGNAGVIDPGQYLVARVETYNGEYFPDGPAPEYGEPIAPITVAHDHNCIRLLLGDVVASLEQTSAAPCILIERRHDRWAVMIFPYADGDTDLGVHIPMTKTERKVLVMSTWHDREPEVIDKVELVPEDEIDWRPEAGQTDCTAEGN